MKIFDVFFYLYIAFAFIFIAFIGILYVDEIKNQEPNFAHTIIFNNRLDGDFEVIGWGMEVPEDRGAIYHHKLILATTDGFITIR